MKLTISGFGGAVKALHPKLLRESSGVESLNQKPGRGDLRPLNAPLTVATVPANTDTIYRMGRDVARDAQYWLSWQGVVHAVRGLVAGDTTERTYFTGDGPPKWTDNTIALASAPYPTTARNLGVPVPSSAITATVGTAGTSTTTESRYYVYTYVTDKGEESAPSPISTELECKPDDTIALGTIAAPPPNYGITRTRIYRTQSGLSGATEFFFLREIDAGLTSSQDDKRALGEVMVTASWLPPPSDLSWLRGMWNGMMAGITGGTVRYCEPYKPYAWPPQYETLPADTKPVALAVFGQTLLVLTTARPIMVAGSSPGSLDEQPLEFAQSCIAPRSAVGMGHGVVWACPDGLAYFGSGGGRIITSGLLTRDDWLALKPETIIGGVYEGTYLGFYQPTPGVYRGFLIDPINPAGIYFLDFGAKSIYFDELQDQLYLLDGNSVKKWDAGAALTATFRSKVFQSPTPIVAPAAAKVIADQYPVTFKLWADGALKHTQAVASIKPFRLPAGYRASDFQIEIQTTRPVQAIAVAGSMSALSQ